MTCPKCGFPDQKESCARCGVVFSKLAASGSPRRPLRASLSRAPLRTSAREGVSSLNVMAMAVLALVLSALAWGFLQRQPAPSPFAPPTASPSPSAAPSSPIEPAGGRPAGEEERGSGGTVLYLPGFTPSDAPAPVSDVGEDPLPALPRLALDTISPELVAQVVSAARERPEDERLRSYAGQAYLLLGARRFGEGRYRESLESLTGAEEWQAPPREIAKLRAVTYLKLQDLAAAERWAQNALSSGPDADMHDVLGHVHYFREELPKAIESWKASLSLRENPSTRASLDRASRELELAGDFSRQRLSHFIVRYEGETMEETGRLVLGSLEKGYAFLKSRLGFEPQQPIVVILYSRRDYSELGGPQWSAGLFDGKVRLPVRGLVSIDRHVESTLVHELTHAFIYARAGRNCPRWLQEGMAEYCEGVRAAERGPELARWIEEAGDFTPCLTAQRCDVRAFYPAAASLVDYIIQNRGMGGMRDLLALLGEGKSIDQALERVMDRSEAGLLRDWQHFVKRRYL